MKNIKSAGIATIIVIIATVILTLWGEFSSGFKGFLAGITGHHWVTKGVFDIILFFIVYFIFSKSDDNVDVLKMTKIIVWSTILGTIIIFLFYVWHFFYS